VNDGTDVDETRKESRRKSFERGCEMKRGLPCHLLFDRQDRHPFFSDYSNSKKGKRKNGILS